MNRRHEARVNIETIQPGFGNATYVRRIISKPVEFLFEGIKSAPGVTERQCIDSVFESHGNFGSTLNRHTQTINGGIFCTIKITSDHNDTVTAARAVVS